MSNIMRSSKSNRITDYYPSYDGYHEEYWLPVYRKLIGKYLRTAIRIFDINSS